MKTNVLVLGAIAVGAYFLIKKNSGRPSPCPPIGDIDGDGKVTANDAEMVANYFAGTQELTDEQISRARVRGQNLSIVDALVIKQFADGVRDTFPVCNI